MVDYQRCLVSTCDKRGMIPFMLGTIEGYLCLEHGTGVNLMGQLGGSFTEIDPNPKSGGDQPQKGGQ